MNQKQWLKFWMYAYDPIFYNDRRYVDLKMLSAEEYPILAKLDDFTELEVLVMAYLINNIKTFEPGFNDIYIDTIVETFENYDCTVQDIDAALTNLHNRGWVEFYVDEVRNEFIYQADLLELTKAGLYIPDNEITLSMVNQLSDN